MTKNIYTVLPAAEKKGIELILDVTPGTPDWIVGDSLRLRQILVNLLNNSVKFTDRGYILLSVSADPEDLNVNENQAFIFHIDVKDTGCGVKPDSQGKLFQMFSQVDSSSTRRFGGTGIGLALARRFAEKMGGKIWMESTGNDGDGSTFSFTLPAFLAVTSPPAGYLTPFASALLSPLTSVVVVDPSSVSRSALKNRLTNMGFKRISIHEHINEHKSLGDGDTKQTIIFLDTSSNYGDLQEITSPATAIIFMGSKRPKSNSFCSSNSNPSIFNFARKPLKESAICQCINSISLQLHHFTSSSSSSPPTLAPKTKRKTNSFTAYPLSILVVEDNEVNQRVIKRLLSHIGYPIIAIAGNGEEALVHIDHAGLPDLIFMDIQMPILDGVQCTKILRERYGHTRPYIISLTADAYPEDKQNCIDAGMNDFLTKPVRLEELQTALQTCFNLIQQ